MPYQRELLLFAAFVIGSVTVTFVAVAVLHALAEYATRLIARLLGFTEQDIERWETWSEDIPANAAHAAWEESMKRPVKKADEHDTVTGWRRYLCYLQRPGATDAVKRRLRRRERHVAKHRLRTGQE